MSIHGVTCTPWVCSCTNYLPEQHLSKPTAFALRAMRKCSDIIREEEPPRPSLRLSTLGEKLTVVAKHRSTDPATLRQQVRGELDWIVLRCLEKDRSRRYESPARLADDVENFIEGETVKAHPPSVGYRFAKLVRRNRLAAVTTAIVLAAIALGMTGTILMYGKAVKSRNDAIVSAGKAEENRKKAVEASSDLEAQLYRYGMNLAYQAWNEGNLAQLERMLGESRPDAINDDPPLELRYLWARYQEMCSSSNVREIEAPIGG